jgi:hypothetical protein
LTFLQQDGYALRLTHSGGAAIVKTTAGGTCQAF